MLPKLPRTRWCGPTGRSWATPISRNRRANLRRASQRGTLAHLETLDERIRSRAEHWRIPRMAIVDRNILRLAVYEFLYEPTPRTVAINEALEIARRFSTYEATQFINGILDAIKRDLDEQQPQENVELMEESEETSDDEEGEPLLRSSMEPFSISTEIFHLSFLIFHFVIGGRIE